MLAPADAFNRWEAGQVLAKKLMVHLYQAAADAAKVGRRGLQGKWSSACLQVCWQERLEQGQHACASSNRFSWKHCLRLQCSSSLAARARLQGASTRERMVAAGGVQQSLVDAFRAVLEDPHLDGRCAAPAA